MNSSEPRQLSKLFWKCHNNVNKELKKPYVSYEENRSKHQTMAPKIWLLALLEYLLALGTNQIKKDTEIYSTRTVLFSENLTDFSFDNLLPVHQLIYFLCTSNFLSTVQDPYVKTFLELATHGKTSLLSIKLYDLKNLQNNEYPAQLFVKRLQRIIHKLYPHIKKNKLETRVKLFYNS